MKFFVGTYTKGTKSEGIYILEFDETDKTIKMLSKTMTENPSFLAADEKMLYAVNEVEEKAGYTSFYINDDYTLKEMQRLSCVGSSSCHIAVSRSKGAIYIANYSSGDILCYKMGETAKSDSFLMGIKYNGRGPNEKRQNAPYAHSVNISPNEKHLVVADLGTDKLMVYDILDNGKIEGNAINAFVDVGGGEGPRHLCFHPTQDRLYVVTELLNNVISFSYNRDTGKIEKEDVFPILPKGYTGDSLSAEIYLSNDSKFLYASNRGWDGIVSFRVDEKGKLSQNGLHEGYGKSPRSFLVSDDDEYFVIAYQQSDRIVVVKRDSKTGGMGEIISEIDIPSPICVIPI